MACSKLKIHAEPELRQATMVMGFSGWMDGGSVSTGTVDWLVGHLAARKLAEIEPAPFYIYSFPGTMEVSAFFRPHAKIQAGLIEALDFPDNVFHFDQAHKLILFRGKEPNFAWDRYADCVFSLAGRFNVERMYFVGSVAGVVPHTREPRLFCTASDEALRHELEEYGLRSTDYQGPASLVTYLVSLAGRRGIQMASLVAEIPAYIQGPNPICVESMLRRLSGLLGLGLELGELRARGEAFSAKLSQIVRKRKELSQLILKLEGAYDKEVFDTQMGDLKEWLEQQGIRVD